MVRLANLDSNLDPIGDCRASAFWELSSLAASVPNVQPALQRAWTHLLQESRTTHPPTVDFVISAVGSYGKVVGAQCERCVNTLIEIASDARRMPATRTSALAGLAAIRPISQKSAEALASSTYRLGNWATSDIFLSEAANFLGEAGYASSVVIRALDDLLSQKFPPSVRIQAARALLRLKNADKSSAMAVIAQLAYAGHSDAAVLLGDNGDPKHALDEAAQILRRLAPTEAYIRTFSSEPLGRVLAKQSQQSQPSQPWESLWKRYDLDRDVPIRLAMPAAFRYLAEVLPDKKQNMVAWLRAMQSDGRPQRAALASACLDAIVM